MKILVACEFSGRVRDAFIRKGHEAVSCDLLESDLPGPHHQGDIFDILYDGWDMLIAHPPCTRLANSGVRWLHKPPKGKTLQQIWRELHQGAAFYNKLRNSPIEYKAIENPVIHKYARALINPAKRQIVQPWQFGDPAFKATGFELHGLPELVPTDVLDVPAPGTAEHKEWSKVHRLPPSPDRWKLRSLTYLGIAAAMAEQWPGGVDIQQEMAI